jgi:hypothetical protein
MVISPLLYSEIRFQNSLVKKDKEIHGAFRALKALIVIRIKNEIIHL